jgi:hypothetical protein
MAFNPVTTEDKMSTGLEVTKNRYGQGRVQISSVENTRITNDLLLDPSTGGRVSWCFKCNSQEEPRHSALGDGLPAAKDMR